MKKMYLIENLDPLSRELNFMVNLENSIGDIPMISQREKTWRAKKLIDRIKVHVARTMNRRLGGKFEYYLHRAGRNFLLEVIGEQEEKAEAPAGS